MAHFLAKWQTRSGKHWSTLALSWSLLLLVILSACSGSDGGKTVNNKPGGTTPDPQIQCAARTSTPVTLSMVYGSEKQAWLEDVIKDFNSRNITACDGPITVETKPMGSGVSMQQILDGTLKPDVWSPAGNVWLTLINSKWREKNGSDLIATGANDTPSLVSSPVVIAMWKPQAEALGWPNKAIGWSDIAKLSVDPQGWKSYGHPEFGEFKFGHTHPAYSNSGLDAVIAVNYAATKKTRALTTADVNKQETRDFVSSVESSVIHYGESTGFFADAMFNKGPNYLSAAVMYESLVIEANQGKKYPQLPYPVVAIYPKEGTFYSDHPYTVLQGNWVTGQKKTAAQALRNFLLAKEQQQKALQYGFRPADSKIALSAPFESKNGVDASQPKTLLQVPNASVIDAIQSSWAEQRRRVDLMLVLDRSGSMNQSIGNQTKISGARQGLKDFVNLLNEQDRLGLTVFSSEADELSPVSQLGPKRKDLLTKIDNLVASGETRLFDTTAEAVSNLQKLPSKNIKAVIVLSDGADTVSKTKIDQLIEKITPTGEDAGAGVKVFTIAYGDNADFKGMKAIAEATGGKQYTGNPQNIREVYNQISQFF